MSPSLRAILIAGAIAAFGPPAHAFDDAETGRLIAETWCKPCHSIDQRQAKDVAPSFMDIYNQRPRQEIAAFLANPHGEMPNIQLARQQIADVIAFMATLK